MLISFETTRSVDSMLLTLEAACDKISAAYDYISACIEYDEKLLGASLINEGVVTEGVFETDSFMEAEEVEKKEANTTKKDGILTTLFTNIGKFISSIITAIGNLFGVKAKDTDKSGVSATDVNAMKKHISEAITMSNEFLASDDEEKRDTLLDKIKGKVALIRANPKQAASLYIKPLVIAKAIKGATKAVKDAKANGVTDALKNDGGSVAIGMLKTALSGALDGLKLQLPKIEKDAEKNKNKPTLQAQSKKLADTIKSIAGKVGGIFKKVTGTFKNNKTTNNTTTNNTTTTGGEGTNNESCLLSDNDEDFSTLLKLIF